ncbi:epoxide hydrolase 1-like isoform X2 [Panonychus citri]|uniref:epoxide hydrolase 1-like isoform X2 n=1 Tax=Panonychus citri TaxID=50023 RepID=UPI002307BECE|nr:epoxide hydrolase 1-like isoform X2 [Panonychus citri]
MISWLIEKLIVTLLPIFYGSLVNSVLFLFHLKTCFKNLFAPDYSKRPKVLDDPEIQHHSVLIKKKSIHYVTKGNPDDPIIVFIHGFPDFWYSWHHQLIEFGSKGYYTVAIDLPGYGESYKSLENGRFIITNVADEVAQVIKTIVKSDDQKIILVGHDWGAVVSYCIASLHEQLVSKLIILNGPHPVHFRKLIKSNLGQFLKSWYMFFLNSPFWPEFAFQTFDFFMLKVAFRKGDKSFIFNNNQLEPWKYIYSQPSAIKSALGYYRDFVKRSRFLDHIKLPIHQKMLLIWGDADRALSPQLATQISSYVDNVQLEIIKGAGHFIQLEHPKKISKLISEFIKD